MNRAWLPVFFLLALAVRALPAPTVFTEHGLLPGGLADEYYHLRRIVYTALRFPDVLSFDPYVNFPDGGHIHWPPGYDWALGAVAWLARADTAGAVERVAAWVPPGIGAATVALAAAVARATFGPAAGVTAGLVLAFLPAHYGPTRVGAVDHHGAVALAGLALLGLAMAWLRAAPSRPGAGRSVGLGLAMGVPLLVWPGFLLHVALTQAVVIAAALASEAREAAVARARALAWAHALAAGVVLPFALGPPIEQYGAWSPLVLSWFQPAWLGGGAVTLAAWAVLASRPDLGADRLRRVALAGGLGGVGVAAALVLAPGLREALLYASGWFSKAESFQASVAELTPVGFVEAAARFSFAFFLLPIALVALAQQAARRHRADHALLLAWAAVFLLLGLEQQRFLNSLSVPFALAWGGTVAAAWPGLRARFAGRPGAVAAAVAGGAVVLLVLSAPVVRYYETRVRKATLAWRGELPPAARVGPKKRTLLAAADWLGSSTPPTAGWLDPSARPDYGVLCTWGAGHLVRYRSHRPMVQDNFGVYGGRENYLRAAEYYAETDEDRAVALLERLRVRYVVAGRSGSGRGRPYEPGTMTHRLAKLYGAASPDGAQVPALTRHRLVFHARSSPGEGLVPEPPEHAVGVWERVAGARVEGRAEPGDELEATLRLVTHAGYRHVYRARARADGTGRYALTLPYPTDEAFSDAVRVAGAYTLRGRAGRAVLTVPEAAVRAGATVAGPDLRP